VSARNGFRGPDDRLQVVEEIGAPPLARRLLSGGGVQRFPHDPLMVWRLQDRIREIGTFDVGPTV
jgi:hypothetical protein